MQPLQPEALHSDGWKTVTFEDVTKETLAGALWKTGLTLIEHRRDRCNQVETEILDISELPRRAYRFSCSKR